MNPNFVQQYTEKILLNEPSDLPQLDATMLCSSLDCRRYFYWKFVRNLASVEPKIPLIYGISIHAMLAEWYNTYDFKSALIAFDAAWLKHGAPEGDAKRNPLRAAETMNAYRNEYNQEQFKVVGTEKVGALPIGKFLLIGIIDLIVDYPGYGLMPMDHKTTYKIDDKFWLSMNPKHQYSGYLLLMRTLFGKTCTQNCGSLWVNAILTDKSRCKFDRRLTSRSDWELSKWIQQMNFHYEYQLKPCYDHNEWPQTDSYCQRWGCEYHSLCTQVGVDYRELEPPASQFKVKKWDPLSERR